jgi:sterol desaturase/sphingolipid hydroxylase (fatty acid hydroxylase superfamily)
MSSQDSPASDAQDPKHFGSGWISGVLSTALGAIGLLAVVCFHYPQMLTMPELRALYPVPYIRALLQLILLSSFVLGVLSIYLRRDKSIGGIGILLTLTAAMLGGSRVPIDGELMDGPFLGLDWFLLNLIAFSLIFIPLEQWFPHDQKQPIFRTFWKTDLAYFFVSALFVQVIAVLTLKPAVIFFQWAAHSGIQAWIGAQPFVLQFAGILLIADLTQYWVHRLFHTVPFLWRFHAIHHSAESMDWLAGSRLHIVDIVITRGLSYVPIFLLGFAEAPLFAYIIFVSIHATFIHANFRLGFGPLRWLFVTPRFHHWHHTSDLSLANKNFAVHLPVLDQLFGTYHFPAKRWPTAYGIAGGGVPPSGFFAQLAYPFRRRRQEKS